MSSSDAWGPVPPGVNLSENQGGSIIGSVVAIMAISISAVVLRLFARLMKTGPGLAVDDYVVLAATVFGVGTTVCCLISVSSGGGGKHIWAVTVDEVVKLYQITYAFVIVYITCVSTTKVSILLFYRRMFGTSIIWLIVFGFTVAHWTEVTVGFLSGCRPASYYWRQYTDPTAEGFCIYTARFYFINGVLRMLIDVSILLVPIPAVYKLHMPRAQKMLVCGILLLGSFICVASTIRIVVMDQLVQSADFTWAMSKVFVWSCCEPFIGIVCACLPTYAPLVRRWWSTLRDYGSGNKFGELYSSGKPSKGSKRDWSEIHGADTTLRGDDDIELRPNVTA